MKVKYRDDIEHLNHRVNNPDLTDCWGHSIQGHYYQGYEACEQYAYDILTGKILAGKHCITSVNRFVNDLKRHDLRIDKDMVNLVILFTNGLKHVKGKLAGTPLFLMPWMVFVLCNVFGFYYTSGAREGERRFQTCFILVARGNAKSTLLSAIGLFTMLVNENGSPYVCSAARTAKQARICFEDAGKMVKRAAESISSKFKVQANKIMCPSTDAVFEPVSSDAEGLDGKRISGCGIIDELHAHQNAAVFNAIRTGVTASQNPLVFCISTAGKYSVESIAMIQQDHGRQVNLDIVEDDRYFYLEYSIDAEEGDKWDDPDVWIKANPSLGHAVNIETMKGQCAQSRNNAVQRADFITKYCNLFYSTSEDSYLDIIEFKKGASDDVTLDKHKGKECYLGLDLAAYSDLCSLLAIFPTDLGGVEVVSKNYLPEGVIGRVPAQLRQKYESMRGEHLVFTDGEATDHDWIKEDILYFTRNFDVRAVAYDGAAGGAQFAIQMMKDFNVEMVDVRQGFGLSEPAKLVEALVKEGKLHYKSSDKVLEWCVSNAVYTEGQMQDWKVHKPKDMKYSKVDAVIALLTGMKMVALRDENISVYETRELLVL